MLPSDQAFLYEGLGDPAAMPYNGVYFSSLEETAKQLDWYAGNFNSGTGIHWKIVDKATGSPMGVISVYYYKPEHRKAELGYWLLPRYQGKGYASEVLQPVMQYWQQEKNLHRLEAFVETENTASIRLMEKAGFQLEGTMQDCEVKFGKFISLRIYAMLQKDD